MRGAWVILKKDLGSYTRSWVGVLILFSFLLLAGIFFTLFVLGYSQLSLEAARQAYEGVEGMNFSGFILGAFFLNLGILLLFLAPFLSMRSLAEEKRVGTLELLYTYPLSDLEIVLGKYLALLGELALLFLPSLIFVAVIPVLGGKIDWGIVGGGVLGLLLLGGVFISIGLFFSSLTENQILAAGLTFGFLLAIWILEWFTGLLPRPWGEWFGVLSPLVHFRDFPRGVVDLRDLTFFLGAVSFFFFLTLRVVEARNWKG